MQLAITMNFGDDIGDLWGPLTTSGELGPGPISR